MIIEEKSHVNFWIDNFYNYNFPLRIMPITHIYGYLEIIYTDVICDATENSFEVIIGVRQGCILTQLLFFFYFLKALYTNSSIVSFKFFIL